MGYVMRVFSNYWLKQLVVLFLFLSASTFSYSAAVWSSVGYWYWRKNLNDENTLTTQCDLSKVAGKKLTDGDKNAPRVDIRVKVSDSGIVTDYGDGKGGSFSGDGWFRYAEKIEFSNKLSSEQSKQGANALKSALKNNNCDIANSLLDAMQNPFINDDGIWGIQTDDAKCGITQNGISKCEVQSAAEECDENGQNCHINIGNDKEMTLDEYSKTKPKDKNIKDSPPPNSGNSSSNSGGGSGTSDSGSGSGNSGGSSSNGGKSDGKNEGSQGKKEGGSGVGNGKGDGEGDKEGDGKSDFDKPGIDEFDLKSAFSGLKDSLKDLIPDLSMPGGNCPTVSIPVFNTTKNIDVHCQIFDRNGGKLTAVFSLIWGFLAIRILLSA